MNKHGDSFARPRRLRAQKYNEKQKELFADKAGHMALPVISPSVQSLFISTLISNSPWNINSLWHHPQTVVLIFPSKFT